ncbi:unnamed protein product [Penicillium camemberti]|uniref:Str. FM013 n=1 Tax=Penicillium camemberti (strain FM 013) TaxID=1429867 RepID=A0A0G4NZV8_PENC3|nr:unnamed protein product [Penicillium camemberti]
MEDFNSETDSDYTSYWRDWNEERLSRACPTQPKGIRTLALVLGCCRDDLCKASASSTHTQRAQTQRAGPCLPRHK